MAPLESLINFASVAYLAITSVIKIVLAKNILPNRDVLETRSKLKLIIFIIITLLDYVYYQTIICMLCLRQELFTLTLRQLLNHP